MSSDTKAAKPVSDAAEIALTFARQLRHDCYDPGVCLGCNACEAADAIERLAKIDNAAIQVAFSHGWDAGREELQRELEGVRESESRAIESLKRADRHKASLQREGVQRIVRVLFSAGLLQRVDHWGQAHELVRAALTTEEQER